MRRKHDRQQILNVALALAIDEGLRSLSFGRVARKLGVPDRTVVYYFPTKAALVREVLAAGTGEVRAVLERAFQVPAPTPAALAAQAWSAVTDEEAAPTFRLFFDAVGAAMHDPEELGPVVRELVSAWIQGLAPLFDGPPEVRSGKAEATVALLDGLLLLHHTVGPEASERAARVLFEGASTRPPP